MPSDTRLVGFLSPRTRSSLFSNPTALSSFLQRRKETKSVCLCLSVLVSLCPPLSVCLSLSTRFGDQRPANAILKTVWITLYCSFLSKVTLRRKRRRIQKEDEETKNSPLSPPSPPPPPPQEYCFLIHPGASL